MENVYPYLGLGGIALLLGGAAFFAFTDKGKELLGIAKDKADEVTKPVEDVVDKVKDRVKDAQDRVEDRFERD